jgi:hypothetical protein
MRVCWCFGDGLEQRGVVVTDCLRWNVFGDLREYRFLFLLIDLRDLLDLAGQVGLPWKS